ncbi:hypothetical protein JCM5296_005590 [Sporobolomyces johnsonii]
MGLFDGSVGAFVVGTALSTFLLGITSCQAFEYFRTFPNDKRLYWWLVVGLCVLDWAHSAISMYTIYDWTVTNFANPANLIHCPWSFAVDPAMTGVAAFVCQIFYAYRVYIVGKRNLVIPIIICTLSALSLGFACGATGMIFHLVLFSRFQEWTYGVSLWLAGAALCDIIITTSLVYFLAKSKTGMLQTNNILNRLIELIISTNGLTAAVALIDAVLFGVLSTSYHVTANLCLVKLYFNSLLVSLNARAELERQLNGGPHRSNSHPLNALHQNGTGVNSAHTANSTFKANPQIRTALGFGPEDCDPAMYGYPKSYGIAALGGIADGIKVTTHQTTTTDTHVDGSYPPTSRGLAAYNKDKEFNEKDDAAEHHRHHAGMDLVAALEHSPRSQSTGSTKHDDMV